MNAQLFRDISETKLLRYFLLKPYGLELLFLLSESGEDDGIDDTHRKISSISVQKSMLSNFLTQLESKGVIELTQSIYKKSKKIPKLSTEAKRELSVLKRRFKF